MAKTVLIIEDRRDNIVFIANKVLKPEGWKVITARDGELGLQKAIEEKPDLIITDLKLPKMHGLDVLEELNNRGFRIPTIVMTFHGSEETAIRAFRLGAADYLIKPFEIEDIMNAIDRALRGKVDNHAAPASVDKAMSEKLASQERELERLRALLQQQESGQQAQTGTADTARWRAILKEKEATLVQLKKQTIIQHRAMSQQINNLRAQLEEKEAILTRLENQAASASPAPGLHSGSDGPSAASVEKEEALAQANKLVQTLTRTIALQQQAINRHREEAERLARELHALATGIQMLGQSLGDQGNQMSSILPGEE